ncbi:MAG TPA: geranylgeranyl reductase family protein [Mycobacteriales bacterium]|nr:geranylgeranyl reductase family protein [Mycobacteriales bacterium]
MTEPPDYDVVVIGTGPAGATAARVAAERGARTLLVDRAEVPRYKCCGGGLVGLSRANLPLDLAPLTRDEVTRVTFSKAGRQACTRRSRRGPVFQLVMRSELDAALVALAVAAGAELRTGCAVTGLSERAGVVTVSTRLGDVGARVVVGADGTGGRSGRYVGVVPAQVDLGLEGEFPTPPARAAYWSGRVQIDWGRVPGSYGWVFPKGDLLTVGVIGRRADGDALRSYYAELVARVGLGDVQPTTFSGHLTRCRAEGSPLRRGRVLVAGDAAGLLEPWTREGISYALRSGLLAGQAAAAAVVAARSGDDRRADAALSAYADRVAEQLTVEMAAGRLFLRAFERNRQVFHGFVAGVPGGWRLFTRLVAGETTLRAQAARAPVRLLLRGLGRGAVPSAVATPPTAG